MTQGLYAAGATTAGVIAGAYCAYYIYNKNKKTKLPTTWKKVGTLKDILMYPIKSCAAIPMKTAECSDLGLKDGWLRDRTLMIVDMKNNCVTARTFPQLLLIHTTVQDSILTLTCKDMEPLVLNLEEVISTQVPKEATMWSERYPVYECGWEANEWFSRYLTKSSSGFRLVLFRESSNKILTFRKSVTRAFADELPFNIINQASVDDLNTRLNGVQVSYKQFRTNFLLCGAQAYEEDEWKFVKIGENIFEVIKPCTRCIMATTNPETGIRNSNVEPLATLRSYRQETDPELRRWAGSSPRMGLNMILRSGNGSRVAIDDPISISV